MTKFGKWLGASFLGSLWLVMLFFSGTGCGSEAVIIVFPPPVVEGVDAQFAIICGGVDDPPSGTQIRAVTPTGELSSDLQDDGTFSLIICWDLGDPATFQYFDEEDNPITTLDTQFRQEEVGPDNCPEPSNGPPTCL